MDRAIGAVAVTVALLAAACGGGEPDGNGAGSEVSGKAGNGEALGEGTGSDVPGAAVDPDAPVDLPDADDPIRFTDATAASGLGAFVQENGNREKPFIVESIGAGVALFDYDLDGDLDAYFANGSSLEGFGDEDPPGDALFAGDGRGGFSEATAAAGLGHTGWTCGVRVADVEGDGDPDLFLTCFGANALYRNGGAGRFGEATAELGLGDERWGTGACFLDYDSDGDLDLYVANYVDFDREWIEANQPNQVYRGARVYFGPNGLPGASDIFYRNDQGRFVDVSDDAGVSAPKLHGFQAIAFDHDVDGSMDVYVANDSQHNFLWRNRGDGTFEERGERSGSARSRSGAEQAGMGVALGDIHGDGWLDLAVTNFSEDYTTLYAGEPGGFFRDTTHRAGIATPTMATLGWSARFEDFDLDGHLDLFLANGHVYPQVDLFDLGTRYRQLNQVFRNEGTGRFRSVATAGGLGIKACSRGAAFGDIDGDGDIDVLVSNLDSSPTLLVNESRRAGEWIRFRLVGSGGNRDAIGARIEVTVGGRTQVRVAGAGSGFLSSSDPRLHIGLGAGERVEGVVVRWSNGEEDEFTDLAPGRTYRLSPGNPAEIEE